MSEAKTAEFQEAAEDVLKDEGAVITDVGEVVDGGAAGVHGDFAGFLGDEGLGLVGERIVEMNFGRLRHFWGGKETMIVSEGRGKTNSATVRPLSDDTNRRFSLATEMSATQSFASEKLSADG